MLRVSDNHRFLVHDDGSPFFYLGDTAWELFHRLNLEDADYYLLNRAENGFSVIQAVLLAELEGLSVPNANGDLPLLNNDPTTPNEAYFKHVDAIVDRAASLGLHMGLLPTWGSYVVGDAGPVVIDNAGPVKKALRRLMSTALRKRILEMRNKHRAPTLKKGTGIFNAVNAAAYGEFLGCRYKDKPVIWILGGDRNGAGYEEIWRAMATGLKQGDGGKHLITYHPKGGERSSTLFHNEDWLDFNMLQSGHALDCDGAAMIDADYAFIPNKPCMDGEPCYENIPDSLFAGSKKCSAYDVRVRAYSALFEGACGHTYGCNEVWQMWQPPHAPLHDASIPWKEALNLPGARQMKHLRTLMESRPNERIPAQSLLRTRDRSIRAVDGSYAFVYIISGGAVQIDTAGISGSRINVYWFDPRTGATTRINEINGKPDTLSFSPPSKEDWVLIIDDAERDYSPPEMGSHPRAK
jgi:Protein of unknown function (DUF4038)/Putative collagen-binding domain of a collagenase